MYDLEQIEFKGDKKFLSNMYNTEILFSESYLRDFEPYERIKIAGIEADEYIYNSSEHLYQSLKSTSLIWKELIRNTERPENTKNLAKKRLKTLIADNVETFIIREDFHDIKIDIMRVCVLLKFLQNDQLQKQLILIDNNIEERNCWGDKFWGTVNGFGENWLGKILMETRDILIRD